MYSLRRTVIAVTVSLLLAATHAWAQTTTVTAAWNANSDGLTRGYTVYVGTAPGSYPLSHDAGSNSQLQLTLDRGSRYYVVVRAYASDGTHGPPSNEATIDLTAAALQPPTATIAASVQSASTALVSWSTTNAASATINGQAAALAGSASAPISGTTTFTLVARSATGVMATSTATVTPPPTPVVPTAWISAALAGPTTAEITWATTNAVKATLNGQAVELQGTVGVPVYGTATFTIVATSSTGATVTQIATVTAKSKRRRTTSR